MTNQPTSLEQLYRELGPALLSYFRRATPAADDLLQETFLRAARHPERLERAVSARAYLFGIAHHLRVDAVRRARPVAELADQPDESRPVPDDRLELLRAAIADLPEPHRETVLLKLRQDLSYEEIAAVLGIPVGTVRSRLHHAMALLRRTLNPEPAAPAPNPRPSP